MTADRRCMVCDHLFHTCHLDDGRDVATHREKIVGRCDDCTVCNPPDEAPIRERVREEVPA